MKCELCHQKDAETAITLVQDGEEQELYVCKECARRERVRRQKKSQRTRKGVQGLPPGVSISVSGVTSGDGDEPPPIVAAIMNAMSGIVSGIEQAAESAKKKEAEPKFTDFPCDRANAAFRIGPRLHLEGLHLVGELEPVRRAVEALRMRLDGVNADGVKGAGHAYVLRYSGSSEAAKRVVEDILEAERGSRARLMGELPRVFGDALCRALAILKNCRLLSPGELFDLLSPLRLAAMERLLDGIGLSDIEAMLAGIDLSSKEDGESQEERDRLDAERADEMNRRFEDVVLNERAEERLQ